MTIERFTLDNGMRVVLAPDRVNARVAVALHVGVGFRHEEAHEQGLAHLVEHLLFEGSSQAPSGDLRGLTNSLGGVVNATTHQDYTDFYQVVPPEALEATLFHEADRLAAPLLDQAGLDRQLPGVLEEIDARTGDHPYAGLPWPLLPVTAFTSHPNRHDGYGSTDGVARFTPQDCADFFHRHYAPGNCVLTIAGAIDCGQTRDLVQRYFGAIPGRPHALPPVLVEDLADRDRTDTWTDPGIPRAAEAVAWRMPDPSTDLTGYLTHLVLTEVLAEQTASGPDNVTAGCGLFGPLDALAPDLLILTGFLPSCDDRLLDWARERLARCAAGLDEDTAARAVRHAQRQLELDRTELNARVRGIGRLTVLFDAPELFDRIPSLVAGITVGGLRDAAAQLAGQPASTVRIEAGPARTRPQTQPWERATVPPPAPREPVRIPAPRRSAPGGRAPTLPTPELRELRLPGGATLIALQDGRVDSAQLTLRLPWGAPGWSSSQAQHDVVGHLQPAFRRAAPAEVRVSTDGQNLVLEMDGPARLLPVVLDRSLDLLAEVPLPGEPVTGYLPTSAGMAEDLLRAVALQLPAVSPEQARSAVLSTPGATMTLVTAGSPGHESEALARLWSERARPVSPHGTVEISEGLLRLPLPHLPHTSLALWAAEPADAGPEAARYLATAAFAGTHTSRMRLAQKESGDGYVLIGGRDRWLGLNRVFIRADLPHGQGHRATDDLAHQLDELRHRPFSAAELAQTRLYCGRQLLSAFDSPQQRAQIVASGAGQGRTAHWLWQLQRELDTVTSDQLTRSALALFGQQFRGVELGPQPAAAAS